MQNVNYSIDNKWAYVDHQAFKDTLFTDEEFIWLWVFCHGKSQNGSNLSYRALLTK
jgi:hypothetical protein